MGGWMGWGGLGFQSEVWVLECQGFVGKEVKFVSQTMWVINNCSNGILAIGKNQGFNSHMLMESIGAQISRNYSASE